MNVYKAYLEKIRDDFTLKTEVKILFGASITKDLSLRGLDVPKRHSREGELLFQRIMDVVRSVPFLAVKVYEKKDLLMRHPADFFYLAGEDDPEEVVAKGKCLNTELMEGKLASAYDEKKRLVDFSKKKIRVNNEDLDLVTGNFKSEICMYINDCKQYLRAALEGRPVDMEKGEFDPTDEEFLMIYGMKELKDMSMRLAGGRPLDWQGN
jgi:hypothetical protein